MMLLTITSIPSQVIASFVVGLLEGSATSVQQFEQYLMQLIAGRSVCYKAAS